MGSLKVIESGTINRFYVLSYCNCVFGRTVKGAIQFCDDDDDDDDDDDGAMEIWVL